MQRISINQPAAVITQTKFQKRCESLLKQKFVRFSEEEKKEIVKISRSSDVSEGFEQITAVLSDKILNIQKRFSDLSEPGRKLSDGKYVPGIFARMNDKRKDVRITAERANKIFSRGNAYREKAFKVFSDFVYKPSSNPELKTIEQSLRKKGVKAKFSENTNADFAKLCRSALQDLKNKGYVLPKRISYSPFLPLNANAMVFMSANKQSDNIFFSSKIVGKNLKEIKDYIEMKHAQGIFSTNNPKHIIFHEIGHRLHTGMGLKNIFNQDFSAYAQLPNSKPVLSEKELDLLRKNVSEYSASGSLESVAEIFAGLMDGKIYSPEIMKIYHRLKGPVPKQI